MKIPPQRLNDGNPEDTPASFPGGPLRMAPPQKKTLEQKLQERFCYSPFSIFFRCIFFQFIRSKGVLARRPCSLVGILLRVCSPPVSQHHLGNLDKEDTTETPRVLVLPVLGNKCFTRSFEKNNKGQLQTTLQLPGDAGKSDDFSYPQLLQFLSKKPASYQ